MNIVKFKKYVDMTDIKDSMQLDSNTVIAELTTKDGNTASIKVLGEVRVIYKGVCYKTPSAFPQTLVDILAKMREPDYVTNDETPEIGSQNWFELVYKNEKGENLDQDAEDNVIDAKNMTEAEMYEALADYVNLCEMRADNSDGWLITDYEAFKQISTDYINITNARTAFCDFCKNDDKNVCEKCNVAAIVDDIAQEAKQRGIIQPSMS